MYFASNTFSFSNLNLFSAFINKIRGDQRQQLTRLNLEWEGRAPARAAKLLLDCVGLRELTLKLNNNSVARSTNTVPYEPRLFGMKELLHIRGLTKLELEIPERLFCHHALCPHLVRMGMVNLAEGEGIEAFKERMEVLKQPCKD